MPLSVPSSGGLTIPKLNDTDITLQNFSAALPAGQPENLFIGVVNQITNVNSTSGVFETTIGTDLTIHNKGMFTFPWENTLAFNLTGDAGALIDKVSFAYGGISRTFNFTPANNVQILTTDFTHSRSLNFDGNDLILGNFGRYQISVGISGVGTWAASNISIFTESIKPAFLYEA